MRLPRFRWLLLLLVLVLSGIGWVTQAPAAPEYERIELVALRLPTGKPLELVVAGGDVEKQRGLKGKRLRPRKGMLFVSGPGFPPRFTMAGVPERLAILHLDKSGELLEHRHMKPCRSADWHRCPIYAAPTGTRISIELRPADARGVRRGASIVPDSLAELLVR